VVPQDPFPASFDRTTPTPLWQSIFDFPRSTCPAQFLGAGFPLFPPSPLRGTSFKKIYKNSLPNPEPELGGFRNLSSPTPRRRSFPDFNNSSPTRAFMALVGITLPLFPSPAASAERRHSRGVSPYPFFLFSFYCCVQHFFPSLAIPAPVPSKVQDPFSLSREVYSRALPSSPTLFPGFLQIRPLLPSLIQPAACLFHLSSCFFSLKCSSG